MLERVVRDILGWLAVLLEQLCGPLVLVVLTRGRLGYDRYRQEEPYLATAPTQG